MPVKNILFPDVTAPFCIISRVLLKEHAMTEHSKGTQNGAKLRPQNKVRNLEHQAMRGNKAFEKRHADGHRIRSVSCGDPEPNLLWRNDNDHACLDALSKMRHQNRKVEVDQK